MISKLIGTGLYAAVVVLPSVPAAAQDARPNILAKEVVAGMPSLTASRFPSLQRLLTPDRKLLITLPVPGDGLHPYGRDRGKTQPGDQRGACRCEHQGPSCRPGRHSACRFPPDFGRLIAEET